ncbi:alanine racemase [Oricola sp.]|uniref:alanine racemase n=1 Tax=Oricola sp. TaxID=1979950 RepID=UPI003BAD2E6B
MKVTQNGADPRLAGGRLTIDLSALVDNWKWLARQSAPARCAAVVKANAYGLGNDPVIPALAEAGCDTFFVALPEEGLAVRRLAPTSDVFVFDGPHEQSIPTYMEAGLIPVLSSLEQIEMWAARSRALGIHPPCAIGVDTGMNRLGLTVAEALSFRARNISEHLVSPVLVMSHLACGDDPDHPLNRLQLESFQRVASAFEDVESSLANSAGIMLGEKYLFNVTRPGIAIYGGQAMRSGPNPMTPVVSLHGRIAQIRSARRGETVSYGAEETLLRDSRIAVVTVGYADGYPRSGSGAGVPLREAIKAGLYGHVGEYPVPVLGRVTMDLTMFDVTDVPEQLLADGWIELVGPNIPLDEAARTAGTISYELLTGLGTRYERRYLQAAGS